MVDQQWRLRNFVRREDAGADARLSSLVRRKAASAAVLDKMAKTCDKVESIVKARSSDKADSDSGIDISPQSVRIFQDDQDTPLEDGPGSPASVQILSDVDDESVDDGGFVEDAEQDEVKVMDPPGNRYGVPHTLLFESDGEEEELPRARTQSRDSSLPAFINRISQIAGVIPDANGLLPPQSTELSSLPSPVIGVTTSLCGWPPASVSMSPLRDLVSEIADKPISSSPLPRIMSPSIPTLHLPVAGPAVHAVLPTAAAVKQTVSPDRDPDYGKFYSYSSDDEDDYFDQLEQSGSERVEDHEAEISSEGDGDQPEEEDAEGSDDALEAESIGAGETDSISAGEEDADIYEEMDEQEYEYEEEFEGEETSMDGKAYDSEMGIQDHNDEEYDEDDYSENEDYDEQEDDELAGCGRVGVVQQPGRSVPNNPAGAATIPDLVIPNNFLALPDSPMSSSIEEQYNVFESDIFFLDAPETGEEQEHKKEAEIDAQPDAVEDDVASPGDAKDQSKTQQPSYHVRAFISDDLALRAESYKDTAGASAPPEENTITIAEQVTEVEIEQAVEARDPPQMDQGIMDQEEMDDEASSTGSDSGPEEEPIRYEYQVQTAEAPRVDMGNRALLRQYGPFRCSEFGMLTHLRRYAYSVKTPELYCPQAAANGSESESSSDHERSSSTSSQSDILVTPPSLKRTHPMAFENEPEVAELAGAGEAADDSDKHSTPPPTKVAKLSSMDERSHHKAGRGIVSTIGLMVLGAAIGSVGTIAGLMQIADDQL